MKIKGDFEKWLAALCDYYSRSAWFIDENIETCWRDIRGVDLDALDEIGSWIRSNYLRWSDGFSMSGAIHKGWKVVSEQRAREKAKQDGPQPLTEEQHRRNQEAAKRWIPKILAMNAASKPGYLREGADEPGLRRQRGSR